jgi:general stress protein 26
MPVPAPVTTLDQQCSDPAAAATGWEETLRVLETAELFWLSTVRADGRPHVTPVVAEWSEEAVWFSTGAGEQKLANLQSNPHVVLTTGCNQWDRGLDVVVEGDAVRVTDDAVLERAAGAFAAKWAGAGSSPPAAAASATPTGAARRWCSPLSPSRCSRTPRAIRSAPPGTSSACLPGPEHPFPASDTGISVNR